MTENEMIEKLKNNERGWMFLSEKEQEICKKANDQHKLLCLLGSGTKVNGTWRLDSMLSSIFSLSPDYQFELEYEDVEIIERCSVATSGEPQLGIMLQEVWYALWKIPAMPKFVRFGADDSEMDKFGASCVSFWIQKGKIVYARFRR